MALFSFLHFFMRTYSARSVSNAMAKVDRVGRVGKVGKVGNLGDVPQSSLFHFHHSLGFSPYFSKQFEDTKIKKKPKKRGQTRELPLPFTDLLIYWMRSPYRRIHYEARGRR